MSVTLFGLLAVLGFIVSGFFLWKRAVDEHFSESDIFDVYITASMWALVAGRLGAIALRFDRFGWNPLRWLALFTLPGLDGRAALIVGVAMIVLAAAKRHWDPWLTLDVYLPSVLLWQAALIALYWWQASIVWFFWFLFLLWIEREYRFWEWYRGKRGFAHPGLVASVWGIGIGIGFLFVARLSRDMVFSLASGIILLFGGMVLVYVRSGRVLKSDIEAVGARFRDAGKFFKKRRPHHTI